MNSLDSLQKTKYKWVMDTFLNSQIAHFLKKGKLKRLPFKIHKELLHLNDKKKQPNSKMGKGSK